MLNLFNRNQFFDDEFFPALPSMNQPSFEQLFATDIQSTDKEIVFKSNCPGWAKKDIKISVDQGVLTMEGSKKQEKEEKKEGEWHRIERSQGSFKRSFRLPDNVDLSKASSKLVNGVLTTIIPKKPKEESSKHHITIEQDSQES